MQGARGSQLGILSQYYSERKHTMAAWPWESLLFPTFIRVVHRPRRMAKCLRRWPLESDDLNPVSLP